MMRYDALESHREIEKLLEIIRFCEAANEAEKKSQAGRVLRYLEATFRMARCFQAGEVGKMFGKPLSPEVWQNVNPQGTTVGSVQVVEELHFAFIYAEDGALDALDAWKRSLGSRGQFVQLFVVRCNLRFCDLLKETEKIIGAIDVAWMS